MEQLRLNELYSFFCKSSGVCTDSRNVLKNSIFFALKGDNFDGNKFAKCAIDNGALLAVIDNAEYYTEKCFLVDDVLKTLQNLANYHRNILKTKIIGITGTNGKTTTKELLAAVLSQNYKTVATKGNLNNQIGVPLTLLSITPDVEVAIVEMGANHVSDIEELVNIAGPNYGLITNIGRAHLGGFGSFKGIVKAKTELYLYIKNSNGVVFYNDNNPILTEQIDILNITGAVSYSSIISDVKLLRNEDPYLHISFRIVGHNVKHELFTNLVGDYNLENVMAAISIGIYFGVDIESIKYAIANYVPTNNRSQFVKTQSNTVIMDAYNANPSSMELSIKNFASIEAKKKIVILGEMLELGEFSPAEHEKVVTLLEANEFDTAILIGKNFNGLQNSYFYFDSADSCVEYLQEHTINGYTVLLKGSRGVKLEKILEFL